MEISAKHQGNQLELALTGELDHHGAKGLLACLEQEIQRSLPMVLVLDFSGVTFMDSSGIAVALRGWQRMRYTFSINHWTVWLHRNIIWFI